MKKRISPVSPFIVLLLPVLIIFLLASINSAGRNELAGKYKASACLQTLALKELISSALQPFTGREYADLR